jgi:hypothetical protein
MNIQEFVKNNNIKMVSCLEVSDNPNMVSDNWQGIHYKITLKRSYQVLTTYFSKGMALEHGVTAEELLDCLASDAGGGDDSFQDFCDNFGYDVDSIKALKTYKTIKTQSKKLYQFLGEKLYKTLIEEVERL